MAAIPAYAPEIDDALEVSSAWSVMCIAEVLNEDVATGLTKYIHNRIQIKSGADVLPPHSRIKNQDGGSGFALCVCTRQAADRILPLQLPDAAWKAEATSVLECHFTMVGMEAGDLVCLEVDKKVVAAVVDDVRHIERVDAVALREQLQLQAIKVGLYNGEVDAERVLFHDGDDALIPLAMYHGRLGDRARRMLTRQSKKISIRLDGLVNTPRRVRNVCSLWACPLRPRTPEPTEATAHDEHVSAYL